MVEKGQPAGWIHRPEHPEDVPIPLHFTSDGIVAVVRAMGRCLPGDCLFQLLEETPRAAVLAGINALK